MAQQARPKVIGQSEFLRAQFSALSSVVVMMLSPTSSELASSMRANRSAGWLISNFSVSPTAQLSHASAGPEGLICAFAVNDGLNGAKEQIGIEPDRPVMNVILVQRDALVI